MCLCENIFYIYSSGRHCIYCIYLISIFIRRIHLGVYVICIAYMAILPDNLRFGPQIWFFDSATIRLGKRQLRKKMSQIIIMIIIIASYIYKIYSAIFTHTNIFLGVPSTPYIASPHSRK